MVGESKAGEARGRLFPMTCEVGEAPALPAEDGALMPDAARPQHGNRANRAVVGTHTTQQTVWRKDERERAATPNSASEDTVERARQVREPKRMCRYESSPWKKEYHRTASPIRAFASSTSSGDTGPYTVTT